MSRVRENQRSSVVNMWLLSAYVDLRTRALVSAHSDRGDVPGWVLITVMTAGLVSVLWFAAGDKLGNLLSGALDTVSPSSGH